MTPDDLLAGSISEGMLENCSLTPTHQQASAPGLTADVLHQDLAHILARTTSEFILENLPSSVSAVVAYVRDMLPQVGFSDKNATVSKRKTGDQKSKKYPQSVVSARLNLGSAPHTFARNPVPMHLNTPAS